LIEQAGPSLEELAQRSHGSHFWIFTQKRTKEARTIKERPERKKSKRSCNPRSTVRGKEPQALPGIKVKRQLPTTRHGGAMRKWES